MIEEHANRELMRQTVLKQLSENYKAPGGEYFYEYYDNTLKGEDNNKEIIIMVGLVDDKGPHFFFEGMFVEGMKDVLTNNEHRGFTWQDAESMADRVVRTFDETSDDPYYGDNELSLFYENVVLHFIIVNYINVKTGIVYTDPNIEYKSDHYKFLRTDYGKEVNGLKLYTYEYQKEFENSELIDIIYNSSDRDFFKDEINLEYMLNKFNEEGVQCSGNDMRLVSRILDQAETLQVAYCYDKQTGRRWQTLDFWELQGGIGTEEYQNYKLVWASDDSEVCYKGIQYFPLGVFEI